MIKLVAAMIFREITQTVLDRRSLVLSLLILFAGCESNPVNNDTVPPGGGPEPFILPNYFDYPAWHPAGNWIAAQHGDSVDNDSDGVKDAYFGGIWLVHAETGETQPLVRGFGYPAWSPDGTRLAMHSGGHIFTVQIISLDPPEVDTSSLWQLTTEGRNFFPDWSPDGEWIVYDSNIGNEHLSPAFYDLWIMNIDGSGKRRVEPEHAGSRIGNWSPDGGFIVHQRASLPGIGAPEIFVVDSSGNSAMRLTYTSNYGAADQYPRYSPDGTKIAWIASPRSGPPVIRMMDRDGKNSRNVTPQYAWRYDWSPDGSRIIFLRWDFLEERIGNGQLWLVNIEGFGLRQLTHYGE